MPQRRWCSRPMFSFLSWRLCWSWKNTLLERTYSTLFFQSICLNGWWAWMEKLHKKKTTTWFLLKLNKHRDHELRRHGRAHKSMKCTHSIPFAVRWKRCFFFSCSAFVMQFIIIVVIIISVNWRLYIISNGSQYKNLCYNSVQVKSLVQVLQKR